MITFIELKQGTKFKVNNKVYIKLPENTTLYNLPTNAIEFKTGSVTYFNPNKQVNLINKDSCELANEILKG